MASACSRDATKTRCLISTHVCHPSLCNDNLSGIVGGGHAGQAAARAHAPLLVPLPVRARDDRRDHLAGAQRGRRVGRIRHGLVLTCVGDPRQARPTSAAAAATPEIDRAVAHVLHAVRRHDHEIRDFTPYGYDERQYCSPGFNLPVGVLSRTPHGGFPSTTPRPTTSTSCDPDSLADTRDDVSRRDRGPGGRRHLPQPESEVRAAARQAGPATVAWAAHGERRDMDMALLWVLNFSDGAHSLLDIAERSGVRFSLLRRAADLLIEHELLEPAGPRTVAEASPTGTAGVARDTTCMEGKAKNESDHSGGRSGLSPERGDGSPAQADGRDRRIARSSGTS